MTDSRDAPSLLSENEIMGIVRLCKTREDGREYRDITVLDLEACVRVAVEHCSDIAALRSETAITTPRAERPRNVGEAGEYIEQLEREVALWKRDNEALHRACEGYRKIIDAPPSPIATQWISVKDRLPAMHQTVLLWFDDDESVLPSMGTLNQRRLGKRDENYFIMAGSGKNREKREFSHWMPLPAAPQPLSERGKDK